MMSLCGCAMRCCWFWAHWTIMQMSENMCRRWAHPVGPHVHASVHWAKVASDAKKHLRSTHRATLLSNGAGQACRKAACVVVCRFLHCSLAKQQVQCWQWLEGTHRAGHSGMLLEVACGSFMYCLSLHVGQHACCETEHNGHHARQLCV
jgi:hypothetical protein